MIGTLSAFFRVFKTSTSVACDGAFVVLVVVVEVVEEVVVAAVVVLVTAVVVSGHR